jgi:hypothetical protein
VAETAAGPRNTEETARRVCAIYRARSTAPWIWGSAKRWRGSIIRCGESESEKSTALSDSSTYAQACAPDSHMAWQNVQAERVRRPYPVAGGRSTDRPSNPKPMFANDKRPLGPTGILARRMAVMKLSVLGSYDRVTTQHVFAPLSSALLSAFSLSAGADGILRTVDEEIPVSLAALPGLHRRKACQTARITAVIL